MDVDVTEEFLERLCQPFGAIGDTIIRSHHRQQVPSFSIHGYGVVFYYDATAALRAMEALQGKVVNNIHLRTSLSPKITGEYMRNTTSGHVVGGMSQANRTLTSPRGIGLGSGLGLSINTSSMPGVGIGTNLGSGMMTGGLGSGLNGGMTEFGELGNVTGGFGLGNDNPERSVLDESISIGAGSRSLNATPRAGLSSLLPVNHPGLSLSISTNTNTNNGFGENASLLTSSTPSDRSIISNIYEPYQSNPASRTTTPRNASYSYQEANARLAAAASLAGAGSNGNNGLSSSIYSNFGGYSSQNASNCGTPIARYTEPFSSSTTNSNSFSNVANSSGNILSQSPSLQLSLSELSLTDDRADLLYQQTRLSPAPTAPTTTGKTAPGTSTMLSRNPGLFENTTNVSSSSGLLRPSGLNITSGVSYGESSFDASSANSNNPAGLSDMDQYFMYMNRQRSVPNHNINHHQILLNNNNNNSISPSNSRGSSPRNFHLTMSQQNQLQMQQFLQQQQQQQQQIGVDSPGLPPLPPQTSSSGGGSPHANAAYIRQQQAWLQQQQQQQQHQQQQQQQQQLPNRSYFTMLPPPATAVNFELNASSLIHNVANDSLNSNNDSSTSSF